MLKKLLKIALLIVSLSLFIFALTWLIVEGLGGNTENAFFAVFNKVPFISLPLLIVFYIVNLFKYHNMPGSQKIIWVYLLIGASYFAFPFYWYFHIWRDKENLVQPEDITLVAKSEYQNRRSRKGIKLLWLLTGFPPIIFGVYWSINLYFINLFNRLIYYECIR
jgi:hypothetical protein